MLHTAGRSGLGRACTRACNPSSLGDGKRAQPWATAAGSRTFYGEAASCQHERGAAAHHAAGSMPAVGAGPGRPPSVPDVVGGWVSSSMLVGSGVRALQHTLTPCTPQQAHARPPRISAEAHPGAQNCTRLRSLDFSAPRSHQGEVAPSESTSEQPCKRASRPLDSIRVVAVAWPPR